MAPEPEGTDPQLNPAKFGRIEPVDHETIGGVCPGCGSRRREVIDRPLVVPFAGLSDCGLLCFYSTQEGTSPTG